MTIPAPPPQYFAITPGSALAGPAQRIWSTTQGTIVFTSGDGSGPFTVTVAANTWTSFGYPVASVAGTSTASGLIGEGWGSTPTHA